MSTLTESGVDPKLVERIAKKVHSMLPKGQGIIIMIFPFGTGKTDDQVTMDYISNAQREDVVKVLRTFLDRSG